LSTQHDERIEAVRSSGSLSTGPVIRTRPGFGHGYHLYLTGVSSLFLGRHRVSQSPARPSQAATIITAKHHPATLPRGAVVRNIGGLSQRFECPPIN